MAGTNCTINEKKSCENASCLHSIKCISLGLLLLLCLCGFKTFIQRGNEKYLDENIGHKSRQLLQVEDEDIRCVYLHHVNSSYRCEFVKITEDCQFQEGFIQYIQITYCSLSSTQALAFVLMVFWLTFLFILMGTTADNYFCPALTVISDALNLSPNVAGVTFLAFGNGAPDIFSAVAGFVNSSSTENLALNSLIGAGMFVTTVVVGVVSFNAPYDLKQRPYLRDIVFNLGALAWTVIIVYRKKIDLLQAIGFIILYIIYVLVVIIGRVVYQRYRRNLQRNKPSHFERSALNEVGSGSKQPIQDDLEASVLNVNNGHVSHVERSVDERTPLIINRVTMLKSSKDQNLVQELLSISISDFVDSGILRKIYTVIKIPIHLCLNLTIPVVELDEEKHNWSKRLQILQCLCSPLFCVCATKGATIMLGGKFPLVALVSIVGLILAVTIAVTSSQDKPPRYHKFLAFMGFIASVIWIYSIGNEIVNLLSTFGLVFKLSNEILGVTLLAWGNSVADFAASVAVAKQGYPQMAIAGSFGASVLALLLGVGLPCTIVTARNDGTLKLDTGNQDYISTAFLAVSLASSAIVVPLLGFRIPKLYGIYLIVLYLVFLVMSILNETGYIFS